MTEWSLRDGVTGSPAGKRAVFLIIHCIELNILPAKISYRKVELAILLIILELIVRDVNKKDFTVLLKLHNIKYKPIFYFLSLVNLIHFIISIA